jgi:outer membrane protein assembly factor BamB
MSVKQHLTRYLGFSLVCFAALRAEDQPQWGTAWNRNMLSAETGLPAHFDPDTGTNIRWKVPLGTEAHSSPVVSGGHVFIGTNNHQPRDPKHQGDRGVLMCFDELTGELQWQLVVPKREEDRYFDWPRSGISSPATVEGDRVYVVTNRGEVVCLDAQGLSNGNQGPFMDEARHMTPQGSEPLEPGDLDADILWMFDLTQEAGIWSHDGAHSSILINGPHLYLNTATGVDNTHKKIRTPNAPSLVVLDKETGTYLARENEGNAPNIFHCTWSAPAMTKVNGLETIWFAGGDGIVYGYDPIPFSIKAPDQPLHLNRVWRYDFDPNAPKEDVHRYNQNRREGPSNIFGMPVMDGDHMYIAGGGDLWWGKIGAWLKCITPSRDGDADQSSIKWTFPLERHVMSTPAVTDDLVFIADCGKNVFCLDKNNGKQVWQHSAKGEFWASPYVADGKVYIGSRRGDFMILAATREKQLLHETDLGAPISATTCAANGRLYVATMTALYCLENSKQSLEAF